MATFLGTGADEIIAPGNVSPTVTVVPGPTGATTPSAEVDVVDAAGGNDTVVGFRGDDVALLGAGDDIFFWAPGDGSDVVEGGGGLDTLGFLGAGIAETIDISAVGARALFFRDIADIEMDLDDVELIAFTALGGSDRITVGDLSATDVSAVDLDLGGTPGGAGDGVEDLVTIEGTAGADFVVLAQISATIEISGLSTFITIDGADPVDRLTVATGAGDDAINASAIPAGSVALLLDGGDGNDGFIGGEGAETVLGGAGDDAAFGLRGNDLAELGDGDDLFGWAPGDGNDTVEGSAGTDTLVFLGADIVDIVDISADGERAIFFRQPGAVTMDLNDVETIAFEAFGGGDRVTVGDLTGTDVGLVTIDLEGVPDSGAPDGVGDRVTVAGTGGDDSVVVTTAAGVVRVDGLATRVEIDNADPDRDRLILATGAGDDTLAAGGLPAGAIPLIFDAGDGDDSMLGSAGADTFSGRAGDDTVIGFRGDDLAFLGGGNDVFVWAPGDGSDTVEGGAGEDTLNFIGAGAAETIDLFADGTRATFLRDIADITMDLNEVETVRFAALGGADQISVEDLAGTDVDEVVLDLEGAPGSDVGDGVADAVTVSGGDGADSVDIGLDGDDVLLTGLAAVVRLQSLDGGLDTLRVAGEGGADLLDASALPAGRVLLALAGGDGDDSLRGSAGDDVLSGGSGEDLLTGNAGDDTLGGDFGDDVVVDGAGDDRLAGGAGADTLVAGDGDDTVVGGGGGDLLVFQFPASDGVAGLDVVLGYDAAAGDVVRLVAAAIASSVLDGGDLVVTLTTADADRIRFDGLDSVSDLVLA